jgi:trehalose/maltose hydrolase-like predicted phosphorylase
MAASREHGSTAAGSTLRHPSLDRTFAAVILAWDSLRPRGDERTRLEQALEHLDGDCQAFAASDPDALEGILARLWQEGVGPGLVLVVGARFGRPPAAGPDARLLLPGARRATFVSVGPEPQGVTAEVVHVGGDVPAVIALLEEQAARRRAARVPQIDEDPRWTLSVEGDDELLRRVHEALFTIANGAVGTRGSLEEEPPGSTPLVLVEGVYDHAHHTVPVLLSAPLWTRLAVPDGVVHREHRVLDLRTGVLLRERVTGDGAFRSLRFASRTRLTAVALRAEGVVDAVVPVAAPLEPVRYDMAEADGVTWARTWSNDAGTLATVTDAPTSGPHGPQLDRIGAVSGSETGHPDLADGIRAVNDHRRVGFDGLLREHRAAWARLWEDAAVTIEGDPEVELAVRFAQFHLLASVHGDGEVALGARGLSGPVYAGHVFWDTDVYALPMLAAGWPAAARALLEYRIRRLPAARRAARALGCAGARFPWESADTGEEVTPPWLLDPSGQIVPVHTRHHAEHIGACVAWAAAHYAEWTGDSAFLRGRGRPLLTDTARYWADRVRLDRAGAGHLYGVVGPDEYHGPVDDNAFTNVMARWNLRRAADLVEEDGIGGTGADAASWRHLADGLVDGYDPTTGRYEQFAGFWGLEPLRIADVAQPPVAADLVLGRHRTAAAQVLKQHDVLMLHHLVPDEVAPGSLRANLDFYSPRTAHGSSLAPAIEAALQARAGDERQALRFLRMACRIDLDDLTGTTAGGLHTAAMGGVWQAVVYGFLGVRPNGAGELAVDPRLPEGWRSIDVRLRHRGAPVRIHAEHETLLITCRRPVRVRLGGGPSVPVSPPEARFVRSGAEWKERP